MSVGPTLHISVCSEQLSFHGCHREDPANCSRPSRSPEPHHQCALSTHLRRQPSYGLHRPNRPSLSTNLRTVSPYSIVNDSQAPANVSSQRLHMQHLLPRQSLRQQNLLLPLLRSPRNPRRRHPLHLLQWPLDLRNLHPGRPSFAEVPHGFCGNGESEW